VFHSRRGFGISWGVRPRDPISLVVITVMVSPCGLNSIKESRFLVARYVFALVKVRVVAVRHNHLAREEGA